MTLSALLLCSCILGFLGAWMMCLFAVHVGLFDWPNIRSSHSHPTPRGGGVGIFAAFLFSAIHSGISTIIWIPVSAMAIWALLGDYRYPSIKLRLVGQLFIMSAFIIATCQSLPLSDWFLLSLGFWVIYLVGTANLYNFMDGIDGIAGVTGIIGFGLLSVYLYSTLGLISYTIVAMSISLACLGFLPLNMPQAGVFMGDIGSILLGSAFGCLVYLNSWNLLDFVCMNSFLFPFYADGLTTMVVRLRDGEKLSQAHRRHLYQLLANEQSIPHWKVTLGYSFMQLAVGLSVLLVKSCGIIIVIALLCFYFMLFLITTYCYRKGWGRRKPGRILLRQRRRSVERSLHKN